MKISDFEYCPNCRGRFTFVKPKNNKCPFCNQIFLVKITPLEYIKTKPANSQRDYLEYFSAFSILNSLSFRKLQVLGSAAGLDLSAYKTKCLLIKGILIRLYSGCLLVSDEFVEMLN